MAHCVNINSKQFKNLLEKTGINSHILGAKVSIWQEANGLDKFPSEEQLNLNNVVGYNFKLVNNISNSLPKIEELFFKLGNKDVFWNKLQTDYQIPKSQIELLKNSEGKTINDKLIDFAANYSYTVEINTAVNKNTPSKGFSDYNTENFEVDGWNYQAILNEAHNIEYNKQLTDSGDWIKIPKSEFDKMRDSAKNEISTIPTQHYSNLTVPGGTNYTENEIAIPNQIIPKSTNNTATQEQSKNIQDLKSIEPAYNKFSNEDIQYAIEQLIPDSVVKEPVYHFGSTPLKAFNKPINTQGIYFTTDITGKYVFYPNNIGVKTEKSRTIALVNIVNPKYAKGSRLFNNNKSKINNDVNIKNLSDLQNKVMKLRLNKADKSEIDKAIYNLNTYELLEVETSELPLQIRKTIENTDGIIKEDPLSGDVNTDEKFIIVFEPSQITILNSPETISKITDIINERNKPTIKKGITPSIKGHAQFATPNGIGWFRSDKKTDDTFTGEEYDNERYSSDPITGQPTTTPFVSKVVDEANPTKTRRILEVQTEQTKLRLKKLQSGNWKVYDKEFTNKEEALKYQSKLLGNNPILKILFGEEENWVTFFVKSIIQDSAKKGYEKVLFPVGKTAAKIEGHETVQGFIDDKEKRIEELKNEGKFHLALVSDKTNNGILDSFKTKKEALDKINESNKEIQEHDGNNIILYELREKNLTTDEVHQLEKEIEDAKAGKLKISSIAKFYEETVFNVLKKQGYSPERITDEYGNEWNKVELNDSHKNTILFQLNKEVINKAIPELDNHLLNYLKPFGIKSKEFDELKSRLGIDALGATDIINKLIWLSKNRSEDTVPEEFGHMVTMLMGEQNPLIKELINNIENWSEFSDIKKQYDPIYNNDKQVRMEAIGKLIAKSLVKNYKAYGTDISLIEKALKIVNEFIAKILQGIGINLEEAQIYPTKIADKIALKVLSGQTDIINNTTNHSKLDYNEALKNNPLAAKLIDKFTSNQYSNFKLTGSLAIAKQGLIYRDSKAQIHDLDFKASGNDEDFENLVNDVKSMGGTFIHSGWTHDSYVTYSFLIPKDGKQITNVKRNEKGWISDYMVGDEEPNGKNAIGIDFFWYKNSNDDDSFENSTSFNEVFKGKLFLSKIGSKERTFQREKDQKDYTLFKPSYIGKSDPSFIYYQINNKKETFQDVYNNLFQGEKTFSSPSDGVIEINTGQKANNNSILFNKEDKSNIQDPLIREKYFPNDSVNSKDVLSAIAQSNHPLSVTANRLLDYSDTFNSSITLTKESFDEHGINSGNAAWYNPGSKSIFIKEDSNFKGLGSEPTLIHEIIHSYTQQFIDSNPEHPIVRDLDKAFNYLLDNENKFKDKYPLTSLHEFVAEFFSNGQFISDLTKLEPINKFNSYKNLFQEILDHILSLFRIPIKQRSLYEELFPIMTTLVNESAINNRIYDDFNKGDFFNESYNNIIQDYDNIDKPISSDNIDDLLNIRDDINQEYPDVYASLLRDYDDPTKVRLNILDRASLPEDFERAEKGRLQSSEISQITIENVVKRLQTVFPEINITTIDQENLNQEDHLVPIQDIHSFIRGNNVYLVNGRFSSEDKIEEFLHPFVLGLQNKNIELFNNIFEESKDKYKTEYNYYNTIDENTARNEVVTKAIKDALINKESQNKTWFTKIMDFVRDILQKIFPLSKDHKILTKDLLNNLTVNDLSTLLNNGGYKFEGYYTDNPFYSANPVDQRVSEYTDKLFKFAKNNNIQKIGTDGGYKYLGKALKRVSSIVKSITDGFFKGKEISPEKQKIYDIFKRYGTKLHAIVEDVISRNVDKTTHMIIPKEEADSSPKNLNGFSPAIYKSIEDYISDVLRSYEVGTRFLSETVLAKLDESVYLTDEERLANTSTKGLAGTVDFIAIKNNGKFHVLDFKFLASYEKDYIAAYKKAGYNSQVASYIKMIRNITGAREEDFEKAQIVPFLMSLDRDNNLKDVITPSLDLSKVKNDRNLPFVTNSQWINVPEVKELVDKLNNIPEIERQLREEVNGKKAYDDFNLVNDVNEAVSKILLADDNFDGNMGKLLEFHKDQYTQAKVVVDYLSDLLNSDIDDSNAKRIFEISDYAYKIIEASSHLKDAAEFVYGEGYRKSINKTPEEIELKSNIRLFNTDIEELSKRFDKIQKQLVNKLSESNGITDILKSEKKVTGFQRLFTFMTAPKTRSVALFVDILKNVHTKLDRIIDSGYQQLATIRNNNLQIAEKRGQTLKQITESLIDKSDTKKGPQIKAKFKNEFSEDRNKLLEKGTLPELKEWFGKYYDLDKYRKWANQKIAEKLVDINGTISTKKQKENEIKGINDKYNIDESIKAYRNIYSNYLIENEQFKKDYYSDFGHYITDAKNIAAKEFYDFMIKTNKLVKEHGLIPPDMNYNVYRDIPNVHKELVDKLANGETKGILTSWLEQYRVNPNSGLYGYVDPNTGVEQRRVFVPFLEDYFNGDYDRKSLDLFKVYGLFNEGLQKAIAMKEIAPIANTLLRFEAGKKVLPVSSFGAIKQTINKINGNKEQISPVEDDANAKYLQQFIDAIIYGKKIQDSMDHRWTTSSGNTYSLAKILQNSMGFMYNITFGLNIATPLRSYCSAVTSLTFMRGKDFRGRELLSFPAFMNSITTSDGKVDKKSSLFTALIGYFLPYNSQQFKRKANNLSTSNLVKYANTENLIGLMDYSDRKAQLHMVYALLQNTIIQDGEFINAKRFVTNKYQNFYDDSNVNGKYDPARAKELTAKIDKEISDLIKQKGILNIAKLENGELKIPGLDPSKEEKSRSAFTNLAQDYAQRATGMMNSYEFVGYKGYLAGRTMGMYRSWIPRTVQARAGAYKYNVNTGYEWGRWRSYFDAVGTAWKQSFFKMGSTFLGFSKKESLIKYARQKYAILSQELKDNGVLFTGNFISEKEYIDQYLNDVKNTVFEFRVISGLFFALIFGLFSPNGDDDDEVKNTKSFLRYQLNRGMDEFSFYINPMSFTDIFNKAVPMISTMTNVYRIAYQGVEQFAGFALNNQQLQNKAHPLKYLGRTVPVASEILKYLPIIDPSMAKDLGIKPVRVSFAY